MLYRAGRFFALLGLAFVTFATSSSVAPGILRAARPKHSFGGKRGPSMRTRWHVRVRIRHRGLRRADSLIHPEKLPREPDAPSRVATERFARALRQLCAAHLRPSRATRYARAVLRAAKRFEVDPFLLAALLEHQSGCRAKGARGGVGVGISGIRPEIHRPFVQGSQYRYWVRRGPTKRWTERELHLGSVDLSAAALAKPRLGIHFAAALLAIYTEQCRDLDDAFGGMDRHHPVAHMIWGDRVKSRQGAETILRDRRRLLRYYGAREPQRCGRYRDLELYCPLDGAPRKTTSGFYARRGRRGHRRHCAVDFLSTYGEPVRAVADGRVYFAGVQRRRRRGHARAVSPRRSGRVPRSKMGIGGVFVLLRHRRGLRSGYFHLARFTVRRGQRVKAGQIIGYVGRTGIRHSPQHLHFELRRGRRRINPIRYLRSGVLPPRATYAGRHKAARRRARARARARRRRARRAARVKRRRKAAARRKAGAVASSGSRTSGH